MSNNLKIAIALAYYKRPNIVLNALQSIKEIDYDNWHLFFIDDSGNEEFRKTLDNFGLPKNKYTYMPILDSDEVKIKQGGSRHGEFINKIYYEQYFDLGVTLCDDDAIFKDYFKVMNEFYKNNPKEIWAYCHVKFFNPEIENYKDAKLIPWDKTLNTSELNQFTCRIGPSCRVDGAQVSFRLSAFRELGIKYPSPRTRDCDRAVFEQIQMYLGDNCPFIGTFGQYKGWFKDQLGYRHKIKNTDYMEEITWEKEYLKWMEFKQ